MRCIILLPCWGRCNGVRDYARRLVDLKVHSGEWQDDHYRYETEASGVVRFAHDGERFIGYLHVPGLMSLKMVWVILLCTDIVCRFMKVCFE